MLLTEETQPGLRGPSIGSDLLKMRLNVFDTLIDQPLSTMFILISVFCIFQVVHALTQSMCRVDSTLTMREANAVNNKRINNKLFTVIWCPVHELHDER